MKKKLALFAVCSLLGTRASASPLLYEPFDYPADFFMVSTPVGTTNSTGANGNPKGYLAPNSNNWYGTGLASTYQTANDAVVTNTDLSVAGLNKPGVTRSVSMGGQGHTFRLSLNSSTVGSPNQTATNLTDTPDPLAGTDGTLQASDTAGTGYYSLALQVTDITSLNATGGVLCGFNNVAGSQTTNPSTCGAALTIRPKAGGNPGEFELGIVKQGTSAFASATWDPGTYMTGATIFVVGKYQTVGLQGNPTPAEADDIASLWINPSSSTFGGFDPAGALTNTSGNDIPTNASTNNHTLQTFILRQNGTAVNNQVPAGLIYDELRIGTNYADVTPPVGAPEPSSAALLMISSVSAVAVRRKRRCPN